MQQTGQATAFKKKGPAHAGLAEAEQPMVSVTERKRVEAVVETLANLRGRGETLAEVAHDARNMVTALGLYCDLLEEPGVLNPSFHHYAGELRLVATASRRLVEKLLALDLRMGPDAGLPGIPEPVRAESVAPAPSASRMERTRRWDLMPAVPIDNLAGELLTNRNLLSALAGPSIAVTVDIESGSLPVRLTGEDLTRILVNLVKNAAEAMPATGRIAITLHEFHAGAKLPHWLVLTVEDDGAGIPDEAMNKIFDSGYTTRQNSASNGWQSSHRGLGLSITRSIVEAAGGSIHAANREPSGACFTIELPIRSH